MNRRERISSRRESSRVSDARARVLDRIRSRRASLDRSNDRKDRSNDRKDHTARLEAIKERIRAARKERGSNLDRRAPRSESRGSLRDRIRARLESRGGSRDGSRVSALRGRRAAEEKAKKAIRIAELIFGADADEQVVESQAKDFMSMGDTQINATLRRAAMAAAAHIAKMRDAAYDSPNEQVEDSTPSTPVDDSADDEPDLQDATKFPI